MPRWPKSIKKPVLKQGTTALQVQRILDKTVPAYHAPRDMAAWKREAKAIRRQALEEIYLKGVPASVLRGKPRIVWGDVLKPHKSYVIRKLRYEIYPDFWIPALLYEPAKLRGKAPVVLNPNGHHEGGKAADYKQIRCANLARRGMIALNFEFIGMSELGGDTPHNTVAYMDMTGMAGVSLFYLTMKRGLDVLLAHKHADAKRVCMTGLSGGGWQTIVLSALDERITVPVPVAGYTSIRARTGCLADIGDYEQLSPDITTVFDYPHMTAMLAPRPTLLMFNATDDCCFQSERVKPIVYDAVMPVFKAMGAADDFQFYSNHDPGTHNYDADNRSQLYRFLNEQWGLDTPTHDVHTPSEVFTELQLRVGLPDEQVTLLDITQRRAKETVSKLREPTTDAQKKALRKQLTELLRLPTDKLRVSRQGGAGRLSRFHLNFGSWTMPALVVDEKRNRGGQVDLVTSDSGHMWQPNMHPLTSDDTIKVMVDLLGCGESKVDSRYLMMMQAAGLRTLGIQVAQLLAAADFATRYTKHKRIRLAASGPVCSVVALIAAALQPRRFESLSTGSLPISLLTYINRRLPIDSVMPLMCPDLLTVVDVPQLVALLDGVTLRQPMRAVRESKGG